MLARQRRPLKKDLKSAPAEVRNWALDWMEAASAPGATFASVTNGASPMKGGEFRDCFVRKWRKGPHGEFRLVFRATEDEVMFFALDPRGDDYKTARRRVRALR